ncbi:MAG: AIPR family protein, partial [Candidatus Enterousia sp.]
DETEYKAYLAVVPGLILAKLYEQYGARLLERNVRSFLQARGKVNKGIRETILKKPEMFFAYNNGITATAETIEITDGKIDKLTNLQIVNGGQTTASLFSAYKKDKADISKVFVQMKLSVVSQELANEMVPLISKYANSQNKVNDADFFATHPFHKRMEDFSRRIYAPAVDGQFMQTKWFYERARGQYVNGFAYGTPAEKRKFQTEYPKKQLFTKTDLAKFEGVWMQKPHIVSKGAQYIFLDYADMIDARWQKDDTQFNEAYYRIAIAKAITFKSAEKIVTDAAWYDGGYRANIVAYTLAYIAYKTGLLNKTVDFMKIWNKQAISNSLSELIGNVAKEVHDALLNNDVISNVGQYAKKTVCWENIKKLDIDLPENFVKELVDESDVKEEVRAAKSTQKMDNQIASEIQVFNIGIDNWRRLQDFGQSKRMISPKELGILATLFKNGGYVSTAQSKVLLELLARLEREGFSLV